MADKDDKKKLTTDAPASTATPTFDPKPVNVGGESLVDRIYPHRKKIGVFVLMGFGVWAVIAVVIHFRRLGPRKEGRQARRRCSIWRASKVVDPAMPVDPNNPLKDKFAHLQDRRRSREPGPRRDGEEWPRCRRFRVTRGSLLIKAGKLDEAIAEYKKGQTAKGLDGVLAREGLGIAQEMKAEQDKDAAARQKGLEEALATFKMMQPDDKGPRYAYALYHQGRMQALLGKTADAKATLEKAKVAGKDSADLAPLVDERLASTRHLDDRFPLLSAGPLNMKLALVTPVVILLFSAACGLPIDARHADAMSAERREPLAEDRLSLKWKFVTSDRSTEIAPQEFAAPAISADTLYVGGSAGGRFFRAALARPARFAGRSSSARSCARRSSIAASSTSAPTTASWSRSTRRPASRSGATRAAGRSSRRPRRPAI